MNPNYTLKQLKTFIEVAQHSSVSLAAEHLHVTQPAISMQLKQLEDSFGVSLFQPQGRNIELSPAGEDFYAYCLKVMATLKDLESVISEHAGAKRGRINLAIVSTAKYFTPKLLAAFNREFPDIHINLFIDNKETVFRELERSAVDLVISGRVPEYLNCTTLVFADNPQSFVAHPAHPLAHQRAISYSQLAKYPFVIREQGSGTRAAVEKLFAAHGVDLQVTMEFPSNEVIKQAVLADMGISFLSHRTMVKELKHGYLQTLDIEGEPYISEWQVAHLKTKKLSPALTCFKQFLSQHGQRLMDTDDLELLNKSE